MERKRLSMGVMGADLGQISMDDLMGGGVPQGSIVLLSGQCGTGKTLMSLQYLMEGAIKGERCMYLSFDQIRQDIVDQAAGIGLDLESQEVSGNMILRLFDATQDSPTLVKKEIENLLKTFNPQRVVIDSLSMYAIMMSVVENIKALISYDIKTKSAMIDKEVVTRLSIIRLFRMLKESNATCVLSSECMDDASFAVTDKVARFCADGVIFLESSDDEECSYFHIQEMRYTRHSHGTFKMIITPNGLKVGGEL